MVCWIFARTHVFFYGAYDVELAGAEMDGRESCGDGIDTNASHDHYYGDQSAFLH